MIYELFKNRPTEDHTFLVDMNEITHCDSKYALVKSLFCVLWCTICCLVNCSTPLFCRTICKCIQITSKLDYMFWHVVDCYFNIQVNVKTWASKRESVTSQVCHSGSSLENFEVE